MCKKSVFSKQLNLQLLVCVLLSALAIFPSTSNAQGFNYEIDPALMPEPTSFPGLDNHVDRTIEAVLDSDEKRTSFISSEVVLHVPDSETLDTFIRNYNGEVLRGGALPEPPESVSQDDICEACGNTDYYLIRVDLSMADTSEFESWMAQLEFEGTFRFSSENAVKLTAIIAKEQVINGLNITPNITMDIPLPGAECVTSKTEEYSVTGGGYANAFSFGWLNDSKFRVTQAWQYLDLLELSTSPVKLAMVDTGFAFNSDFPAKSSVPQYHFPSKTYDVDNKKNPLSFGGGTWHGTGTFGIAQAKLNNQFGTAGTSGGNSTPYLFAFDYTLYGIALAIKTGCYWGADIVNVSAEFVCNWWCRNFTSQDNYIENVLSDSACTDTIVVVTAGNSGWDVDDEYVLPCRYSGTLCVGGVDFNTKKASSNYGGSVDIWAPYNGINTTPNPDTTDPFVGFGGTCGSAPYVSGIIAMMKKIDPNLSCSQVKSLLASTSNSSTDSKVKNKGYIDAYAAIKAVATSKGYLPKGDSYEPNDTEPTAAKITAGSFTATIAMGENDYYYFETTDYMDVNVTVNYQDITISANKILAELNSSALSEPATGTLTLSKKMLAPGKHILNIYGSTDAMNCYTVQLTMSASSIYQDKYDAMYMGNTYDKKAVISQVVQKAGLMAMSYIYDLNFHQTGDIDFFEVTLPDESSECLDPAKQGDNFVQGHLTIQAFPALPSGSGTPEGVNWPFEIKVYNTDKSEFTTYTSKSGYNLTIECPHKYFSNGKIVFSIKAKDGRRNFYDVGLYYVTASSTGYIPNIFDEVEPDDVWVIPPYAQEMMPWMFPSDPDIINQYFSGELEGTIPAQYGVFEWEEAKDFDMYLFTEGGQEMGVTLYNENKQVMDTQGTAGTYKVQSFADEEESKGEHFHVSNMPSGTYVLEFQGEDFGTVYSISMGGEAHMLNVHIEGTGGGTVSSNPGGIFCGASCEQPYAESAKVKLIATPDEGSVFAGWDDDSCSTNDNCTVTIDKDTSIAAIFSSRTAETSALSVEPGFYFFEPENTEAATFTITNESSSETLIEVLTLAGENGSEFNMSGDTCTQQILESGQSCTAGVGFKPTSGGMKTTLLFIQAEGDPPATIEAELVGESEGGQAEDNATGDNTAPNAVVFVHPPEGNTQTEFEFMAFDSTDAEDPMETLEVRWDFESNGEWNTEYDIEKIAFHRYETPGIYTATLEVKDTGGLTATATIEVMVEEAGECPAKQVLEDDKSSVNILYGFRDRVLAKTTTGRQCIKLYYRHSSELMKLFSSNPDLAARAAGIIRDVIPHIEEGIKSGKIRMPDNTSNNAVLLLANITAAAQGKLKNDLQCFAGDLKELLIKIFFGQE